MGLADIPTSFGSSFFIRIFFPASIATALYSLAFYGVLKDSFWFELSFENKILVLIMILLLIGILLNTCDVYIYKLYEGIWLWPNFLQKIFYDMQIKKFKTLDNELEATYNQISKLEGDIKKLRLIPFLSIFTSKNSEKEKAEEKKWLLNRKLFQISAELRKFPYNPNYNSYSQRYPNKPTELGNVIEEYELYSEKQYGMHIMVFWQHLWLILPQELRDDLDLRGAKADFNVYMSFLLLLYLPISTIGFWFQSDIWYHIFSWNIPAATIWKISLVISLIGWFVFYKISISEHKTYGKYIKAAFDIYRFDLASKLNIQVKKFPEVEKESWEKMRDYFLDYQLPEK